MRIKKINILGPRHGYVTFIEVRSDDGLTGIGSTDAPRTIVAPIIEHGAISLRNLLLGEDPREPRRLWRKMFEVWQARRGRGSEGGLAVNAMAAIDMALWDLAGKAARKPIYELLGGAVQKQIMAYASATLFTVARDGSWVKKTTRQLFHECEWCLERGFKAIKYGWGNCFEREDEKNLAALRKNVGPKVRLMIDFGCPAYWEDGWNAKKAAAATRLLEKYGVYFLEEPLVPHDFEEFKKLSKIARVKIATGESLTTEYEFAPFIKSRALDIIQPDAQQMGITQFHRLAKKAEKAGILCVPHGPWTAMCVASHIHLLATIKTGDMIEYPCLESVGWNKRTHDEVSLNSFEIVEQPPVLKDGYLQLPKTPGLGVGGFVHSAIKELDRFYPAKRSS